MADDGNRALGIIVFVGEETTGGRREAQGRKIAARRELSIGQVGFTVKAHVHAAKPCEGKDP